MFEPALNGLAAILNRNSWAAELAGIPPLSALIEFIGIPPRLHVQQLAGFAALWNSTITPAGSRLLLSEDDSLYPHCYLDRFGNSIGLLGLDGLYGNRYYVSSPETIRMCIRAHRAHVIENVHENMKSDECRLQNLEIIDVSRLQPSLRPKTSSSWPSRILLRSTRMRWAHMCGWVVLLGVVVMSGILRTWLSLAFFVLMPITGATVLALHGSNPRRLLIDKPTKYNRLILVAEHENTTNWVAFYGETTILNSLLNRPLKPLGSQERPALAAGLRMVLRALILGQWAIALGAAVVKDWNAYFITFWIAFCIFMQAYVMPPEEGAMEWMKSYAGIKIQRHRTTLSTRRALLNTLIALNPDTFALLREKNKEDRDKFAPTAMKWIDPILVEGPERTRWEMATLKAMNDISKYPTPEKNIAPESIALNAEWKKEYKNDFWAPFIHEGLYVAAKIKEEAKLPGLVDDRRLSEI